MRLKKRTLILLAAAVAAIGIAVGAYAYFTSTGTGTGSATVGTDSAWTVGQTAADTLAVGPLYPDTAVGTGTIQTNSYHVKNNSTGNQALAQVDISIANADGSAWSSGACTKDDFSVGGEADGVTHTDTSLAGTFTGGQDKTTGTVTVQMIDNNANQNDCRGLTVPLYFSAS